MKILVLKEESQSGKPDLMTSAITETFSQSDDIVTIATMKVGGILKTIASIKELIKQYKPDLVVAQKMLASMTLFELPKSIKKIIIDPYLLLDSDREEAVLTLIMNYNRFCLRLNNWLTHASSKLIECPESFSINNSYCIVRNRMNTMSQYDKLVNIYKSNNILKVADYVDVTKKISNYHYALSKARVYFEPDFEMPHIEEQLKE